MKRLRFDGPYNASNLLDDLLALPELQPVVGALGLREAVFTLAWDATGVTLVVPDDADEAEIAAVWAAHDLTPAPEPERPDYGTDATVPEQAAEVVRLLRAYLGTSSPTAAQTVAALKLLIRLVLLLTRRVV